MTTGIINLAPTKADGTHGRIIIIMSRCSSDISLNSICLLNGLLKG